MGILTTMHECLTATDALAVLSRSSLPTVVTEGLDDYRVMRKIEERLSDLGLNFLPVGGKQNVLDVWQRLDSHRRGNTVCLVDLDLWVFDGIPDHFRGTGLYYSHGYSIENDMFIDADLLDFCEIGERQAFLAEIQVIAAWYAREIEQALVGASYSIATHPTQVLANGDISADLSPQENLRKTVVLASYAQTLRGKNLLQLLARQLNRPSRHAKLGYKQLYEIGSKTRGPRMTQLEVNLRQFFAP